MLSQDLPWRELAMIRHEIGSNEAEAAADEKPARSVSVGSFGIAVLTMADFATFVADADFQTTAEEEHSGFSSQTGLAVAGATWLHPHGGQDQPQPDKSVTQVSWFDARAYCHWSTHRLPTEAEWETAARLGAIDLDVQLWCEDWYDADFHRDEQRVNPTGPKSGVDRVARGGGNRLTERFHWLPDFCHDNLGIAVVRNRYW